MATVPHPGERDIGVLVQAIRSLFQGRSNAKGLVTLTENVTSTTVTSLNCGADSAVFLSAKTANAATEVGNGSVYVSSVASGSFVITHANAASTDRTFSYVCLG